jgi:hypothetical protein
MLLDAPQSEPSMPEDLTTTEIACHTLISALHDASYELDDDEFQTALRMRCLLSKVAQLLTVGRGIPKVVA